MMCAKHPSLLRSFCRVWPASQGDRELELPSPGQPWLLLRAVLAARNSRIKLPSGSRNTAFSAQEIRLFMYGRSCAEHHRIQPSLHTTCPRAFGIGLLCISMTGNGRATGGQQMADNRFSPSSSQTFPDWQQPLEDVVRETDPQKVPQLLEAAE